MSSEHTKIIAKGAGISAIGILISKILSYLYRIFIARFFGPDDYGLFSLGLAVIGVSTVFGLLGLNSGMVRFIPFYRAKKDISKVRGTIINSLLIGLVSSISVMIILILSADWMSRNIFHNPDLMELFVIMFLAFPFLVSFLILVEGFRGFKEIKYKVYSESIFLNTSNLVTVLLFGLLGFGLIGIALSYTISIVLTLFFSLYLFQRKVFPFLSSKIKAENIRKELLEFSLPLALSGFFSGFISSNISLILIGYLMSPGDVGIYNAALPTARVLQLLAAPIMVLFLPVITELHSLNKVKDLERTYKSTVKWIFFLHLPLVLVWLSSPNIVVTFLFGQEYSAGASALFFLSLGVLPRILATIHNQTLLMLKKTKITFYISLLSTLTNLPLNWVLIQRMGIEGAAIASLLTYLIQYLLFFYFSYHYTRIFPFSHHLIKVLAAGFSSFLIFYWLSKPLLGIGYEKLGLIFLLIGYLVIYFFLLLILRALEVEDLEILKVVEKKSGLRIDFLRNFVKKVLKIK